jgi:diacylglycerol O-acyltransferase / wax synthase
MRRGLFKVATLENMIDISAPAHEVFDLVVDLRNEPQWNPELLHVQMLTPDPVDVGTRFRATFGRGVGEAIIEDTQVDRPHTWKAVSRSRVLNAESEGEILDLGEASRLVIKTRLLPRGMARLLTPALGWWMHHIWEHDLRTVKTLLEHDISTAAQPEPSDETIERVPVPDLCALWAETLTAPMNIALIGVVEAELLLAPDGTVALDRIRSFVEARLPRAPMLLRALRPTHLSQGTPAWIDTPHFEIADHVNLAPADRPLNGENDFLSWCAHRSLLPLDRARPLWRLDIIPGLPEGRVGVLLVLHHVVADGLRGVALITSLLDSTPRASEHGGVMWRPRPAPTALDLVLDNLRRRRDAVRRFRASRLIRSARMMRALSHTPGRPAPSTSLTGPIGSQRHLTVLRYSVATLRATAHANNCTINDLLIAAITDGLRELLNARGENQDGLQLLASVPVGAHGGNEGGMFITPLPVGVPDRAERLRIIKDATARGKKRPDQGIAGIVALPASLARLGVAWAKRAAASHINSYITNVPGPTTALYFDGAQLLEAVPLAPLVAGVRLSVTAMSYGDQFAISLLADNNIPDLAALAAGVRATFDRYINERASPWRPERDENRGSQ